MTDTELHEEIRAFGAHYQYDASYIGELLDTSRVAFDAFRSAQPLSGTRSALPLEAHFVARIATMQEEDCGGCEQLNIRMALEAGVDRELLRRLLDDADGLPRELRDVRALARAVCNHQAPDPELVTRLREEYGADGLGEIAVAIAGSRLFPSLKKALGHGGACERPSVDV